MCISYIDDNNLVVQNITYICIIYQKFAKKQGWTDQFAETRVISLRFFYYPGIVELSTIYLPEEPTTFMFDDVE